MTDQDAAEKYATTNSKQYLDGSDVPSQETTFIDLELYEAFLAGCAHKQGQVEEWKSKYINARISGFEEGKREATEDLQHLVKAVEFYASLEEMARVCPVTINLRSEIAISALAKAKGETPKVDPAP